MKPPPKRKWRILPDSENHFRWESLSDPNPIPEPQNPNPNPRTTLPSMFDLLLQGSSKIFGNGSDSIDDAAPMFQTGSGKTVAVQQSSIQKAMSVFEDGNSDGMPMFRTGSGKSVAVKQSSIQKAMSVFEDGNSDGMPMFRTGSGKSVAVKQSSIQKAMSVFDDGNSDGIPMFRTGSGKSVAVKQSSIQKAMSVFEDGNGDGVPMFRTGLGRPVAVKESSIRKALNVFQDENDQNATMFVAKEALFQKAMPSPMFRTGSGKSVDVKESSIRKALAVIGDGNDSEAPMFQTGSGKSVTVKTDSMKKALAVLGEDELLERDWMHQCAADQSNNFSNSIFQSGSGRKVDISSAGLFRARTLLGLKENENPCSSQFLVETAESSCPNHMNRLGNSWYKDNGFCASHQTGSMHGTVPSEAGLIPKCSSVCKRDKNLSIDQPMKVAVPNLLGSNVCESFFKQPPLKFETAEGGSISVSTDALQRARNLLGDLELGVPPNDVSAYDPFFSLPEEVKTCDEASLNKENVSYASSLQQNAATSKYLVNGFPPNEQSFFHQESSSVAETTHTRDDMPQHADIHGFASEVISWSSINTLHMLKPSSTDSHASHMISEYSMVKDLASITFPQGRSLDGPLIKVSNNVLASYANQKNITSDKRRLGRRTSISPFKRPRSSRFSTPFNSSISFPSSGSSTQSASEEVCCRAKVSTRYPFQVMRKTIKEFFGGPPYHHKTLGKFSDEIRHMNVDSAEKYTFHCSGLNGIGVEAFIRLLVQSGASPVHATKEWVSNHYKWIVWKLACVERCYPAQANGKYLTMSNVLEELKYRYEREVNHGHRSALKRILDGDASPASMMVLCISAIRSFPDPKLEKVEYHFSLEDAKKPGVLSGSENSHFAKIELTDGWYSLDANLDAPLSKQLAAGKLFVGQKIRIWGASLCGWVGPVSAVEVSKMVNLVLHINGTYRAHWADRLGFCRGLGAPLAFSYVKCDGGPVPRTLVGVTRIYPILYKERCTNGDAVVRSERMEAKSLHLYNQRRSIIAEGIMSESQNENSALHSKSDSDSEEGAEIFKLLETAAEPEVLMADMSSEQLVSFANYKSKWEAIKQSDMLKKVEKALDEAGLSERQVTCLMRVRVVGLTSKCSQRKNRPREGIITLWNPTEKQLVDLAEGKLFYVGGLVPQNLHSNIIYLQARGSTTKWQPLRPSAIESFEPFFTPRKSVLLSNLGEVPLANEFDMAAVILYVGEVFVSGQQKKQWIFVTDGSNSESELLIEGYSNCLLAICFCSSIRENDSIAPVNYNLAGSTVGFCNLVKRPRDQVNHLWVADATENTTYSLIKNFCSCPHLKEAANSACKWATISSSTVQKLKERVLCILGVHSS